MLPLAPTPLVCLGNLFPGRDVFAKCEFLLPSGSFKVRGAVHLLEHLTRAGTVPRLVVPSSGNTAVGAAVAAAAFGAEMVGVVPQTIARAKDEKLRALGVELVKIAGGGSELLRTAEQLARDHGGYFVHPHLDPHWTDGYRAIAAEVRAALPACRTLVIPVGGGGLLMGLLAELRGSAVTVVGCEPFNYPKYAKFDHARTPTVADGLVLETPHPSVQKAIADAGIEIGLVPDADIRTAVREVYETQGLVIEPSSAIALAYAKTRADLAGPVCVVLTGENITREDHRRLIAAAPGST
jgi:threonine dehydratase